MSGPHLSSSDRDPQRKDETNYQQRNFVNLVTVIVLLVIAIGVVWVVNAMEANETLDRCLETGRRDCVRIDTPPRQTIRLPDN
jgi:hypothetical protein